MIFRIGDNIQINQGLDIQQSVYLAGFQFAGSSDEAASLAIAARGIGQVIGLRPMLASTNPGVVDQWVKIAWQIPITNLLPNQLPQKFNQQAFEYSQEWLAKYFSVI